MPPIHEHAITFPTHTAFLRRAQRHEVAAGVGLAKLAMWYASEGVRFDESVAALAERAGDDSTAVRAAYEFLAFTKLPASTHAQVMALFMVDELRGRVERPRRRKRSTRDRVAGAARYLTGRARFES